MLRHQGVAHLGCQSRRDAPSGTHTWLYIMVALATYIVEAVAQPRIKAPLIPQLHLILSVERSLVSVDFRIVSEEVKVRPSEVREVLAVHLYRSHLRAKGVKGVVSPKEQLVLLDRRVVQFARQEPVADARVVVHRYGRLILVLLHLHT